MSTLSRSVAALLLVTATAAAAQRAPVKLPPRPEVLPARPAVLPKATYDSLPNGLRFAVVENHTLPLVVVQTALAGQGLFSTWLFDSPAKPGAFALMLATLREGTATRSAAQITDEALDLGTDLRLPLVASTAPALVAARSTWKPSLDLLADVMMNATLTEASVAKVKSTISGALDRLSPVSLANRVMTGSLYGRESAYNLFPTSASLRDITRDDVAAMKEQYLRPQNTMLVVAGDVTVAEARAAVTRAFGSWQRGGTTISIAPLAPTPAPTTIYLKDSPGLNQAVIVGSQLMPGRDNPDAAAVDALALLLGDFSVSSGSRVYSAFRLERGLSYSPSVNLATRPVGELVPLYATVSVAPGMADTAINVLVRVLRDLKQDKPALASELDFSMRNLIGRVPSDLQRLDRTAALIVGQMQDRLPPDYLNQWIGRINGLTLDAVQAAAARYLDPDHMSIVVVADRAKVEAALRATGIPVVIVDK